jgi:hypothetical protein
VVSAAPLPATAETCAAERHALRAHIQAAQADTDAHQSPAERFAKGPADPKLADELRRHIAEKLGAAAIGGLVIECRNLVCRNHWPDAPRDWQNQFYREPWFRKMVDGMMVGDDVYMLMAPGPRADGLGFLQEIVKKFDASSAPDDCAARFPATGTLKVKFHLPKTGEANDDGETGRISAVYGDTLAGTPIGKCMQDAIARTVLVAPLPALPVAGAVHYRRFEFPRASTR